MDGGERQQVVVGTAPGVDGAGLQHRPHLVQRRPIGGELLPLPVTAPGRTVKLITSTAVRSP